MVDLVLFIKSAPDLLCRKHPYSQGTPNNHDIVGEQPKHDFSTLAPIGACA